MAVISRTCPRLHTSARHCLDIGHELGLVTLHYMGAMGRLLCRSHTKDDRGSVS